MSAGTATGRLEVLLKEAELVTQDIHKRLDVQRQSFNYALIAFGVAATVLAGEFKEEHYEGSYGDTPFSLRSADEPGRLFSPTFTSMILLLPVLVGPLAYIFFDDELIIFRNLYYLRHHALPEIRRLSEPDEEQRRSWRLLLELGGLYHVPLPVTAIHLSLSVCRWLLFIVPVGAPIIYALAGPDAGWLGSLWAGGWWSLRALLFVLDCAIALLLVVAIVAAVLEQVRWRRGG